MILFDYLVIYPFLAGAGGKTKDSTRIFGVLSGLALGFFEIIVALIYEIYYFNITTMYKSLGGYPNRYLCDFTGVVLFYIIYYTLKYIYIKTNRLTELVEKYKNASVKQIKTGIILFICFMILPGIAFLALDIFYFHPGK